MPTSTNTGKNFRRNAHYIGVYVPIAHAKALAKIAKREDRSISAIVRTLIATRIGKNTSRDK